MTRPLLQAADLRAAGSLTADVVAGLLGLADVMHGRIASLPRPPGSRHGGITGPDRETVRGVTRPVARSAATVFAWLAPALAECEPHGPRSPEREAVLAALNGLLGDYLAATDNPLAIPMQFRHAGRPLSLERHAIRSHIGATTPRLLVLLHGLCMNDLQWHAGGHAHGEALARDLGYAPVHLHYNSGLSVSTNGRILAPMLERLYDVWPLPIERLVLLGHGMGGLVARSAIHHGALVQRGGLRWPTRLDDLVCLGTPHQGSTLEKRDHGVAQLLDAAPYADSLARLGKRLSAGAQDLAWGNVLKGPAGHDGGHSCGRVRLPAGVRSFAIAGSQDPLPGRAKAKQPGDGLVPLESALGRHHDAERALDFEPHRQAVVNGTGHFDLLSSTEVYGVLRTWLK